MLDWTKSAYLRFTADKIAEMCQAESGPDPVNAPEEVYRRYGQNGENPEYGAPYRALKPDLDRISLEKTLLTENRQV